MSTEIKIGKVYGDHEVWSVVRELVRGRDQPLVRQIYRCQCACGRMYEASGKRLRSKAVKQRCGECTRKERGNPAERIRMDSSGNLFVRRGSEWWGVTRLAKHSGCDEEVIVRRIERILETRSTKISRVWAQTQKVNGSPPREKKKPEPKARERRSLGEIRTILREDPAAIMRGALHPCVFCGQLSRVI